MVNRSAGIIFNTREATEVERGKKGPKGLAKLLLSQPLLTIANF